MSITDHLEAFELFHDCLRHTSCRQVHPIQGVQYLFSQLTRYRRDPGEAGVLPQVSLKSNVHRASRCSTARYKP